MSDTDITKAEEKSIEEIQKNDKFITDVAEEIQECKNALPYIQAFTDYLNSASNSFAYNRDFLYLYFKDYIKYLELIKELKLLLLTLINNCLTNENFKSNLNNILSNNETVISLSIPAFGLMCNFNKNFIWEKVQIKLEKPKMLVISVNIKGKKQFNKNYFLDTTNAATQNQITESIINDIEKIKLGETI